MQARWGEAFVLNSTRSSLYFSSIPIIPISNCLWVVNQFFFPWVPETTVSGC